MRRRIGFAVLVAIVTVACVEATASADSHTARPRAIDSWDTLDASMRERVDTDGLPGAVLVVARDGTMLHEASFRNVTSTTTMPIASASKWLTSATLMTLVDEGLLSLDDRVSDHLSGFGGTKRSVRVRHLLAHTSGLAYDTCVGDPDTSTQACTARIAGGPAPATRPGRHFTYSSVGYEVVARLIEVLTDQSFEQAFEARIAVPVGMRSTRFDTYEGATVRHPVPAASAVSTVADYARFLAMLANFGAIDGRRVLQAESVAEIERNQVQGIETRDDAAARTTGIHTYGLGVWRDVVGRHGDIRVVSGSGAYGFYPWIDRRHGTYGIVGVADVTHDADHAVPASQRQARASWRTAARISP